MSHVKAKVLYDFEAQAPGEINIREGDTVTVTNRNVGEGWCEGINAKGEAGLFPESYVTSQPPYVAPSVGNGSDATSDWDDWDEDDETPTSHHAPGYGASQRGLTGQGNFGLSIPRDSGDITGRPEVNAIRTGTVRRFNRFSNFVKSGGEAFLLGTAKVAINSADYVTIVDTAGVISWSQPYPEAMYSAGIKSPKKETKLKGLKSFIAYSVIPSFNNQPVYRRYKHFDWLHERLVEKYSLIPIPPLPDKQVTGRYENEFIEHRMQQLRLWVNRMCRHPVLSQSAVWHHFLTCGDEKQWKVGKRKAEKDELQGANFFNAIQAPETPLELSSVERQTEAFIKFTSKMDDSVQSLYRTAQDQIKKCQGPYKRECIKISDAFKDLAIAFELDTTNLDSQLNSSIRHTGETYESIGRLYDETLRHNWENMADTLYEYRGILSSWPDIINIHRTFLGKRKEYQRQRDEGKVSAEDYVDINRRTDVVTYATLAEITHFQQERVRDYREMMHTFLQGQIDFYENIVAQLRETQARYR
ncbi:sorting nexin-18-like isoform X3 [Varroa jacobsoni]|uniref:Sorting nexin n=1 Tax=Varroa destructor TaxID=109461 RepID=A0A7M7KXD1_VARDE|nr:sorting nexin-18-like isoform X2 [Varroa destructor]XP_022694896.1 sorting nexin-18-like isoform X3 [Varroa jacobsoni]